MSLYPVVEVLYPHKQEYTPEYIEPKIGNTGKTYNTKWMRRARFYTQSSQRNTQEVVKSKKKSSVEEPTIRQATMSEDRNKTKKLRSNLNEDQPTPLQAETVLQPCQEK